MKQLAVASLSFLLCGQTVVQSNFFTELKGYSLVEKMAINKEVNSLDKPLNAFYLRSFRRDETDTAKTRIAERLSKFLTNEVIVFGKEALDMVPKTNADITYVGFVPPERKVSTEILIDPKQNLGSMLQRLERQLYLTHFTIIDDGTLFSVKLSKHYTQVLKKLGYKSKSVTVRTIRELQQKMTVMPKGKGIVINLTTRLRHEESGKLTSYKETTKVLQNFNRRKYIDVGFHPNNSICFCISDNELLDALENAMSNKYVIHPGLYLNPDSLNKLGSKMHIDALEIADGIIL